MEIIIGIVEKSRYLISNYPNYRESDFVEFVRAGVTYYKIVAFDYSYDFDIVFNNEDEFNEWLVDFVYFIIPTDFVSMIDHYSGFVKEALIDKRFDIICATAQIDVEGNLITVPTAVVNVIPCSVTHWTEDGLAVLDAVIGSWNNQNPKKVIDIPYKFESMAELQAFIEKNK